METGWYSSTEKENSIKYNLGLEFGWGNERGEGSSLVS